MKNHFLKWLDQAGNMAARRVSRSTFLALVVLLTPVLASNAATPVTVVTDSQPISGFELSRTSVSTGSDPLSGLTTSLAKGLFWWNGPGICAGEGITQYVARIFVRGYALGGSRNVEGSCHVLKGTEFNVVRDDNYVYFFKDRQLHKKAVNATATATDPDPSLIKINTPPDDPTLPPNQLSSYLELAEGRIYWCQYLLPAGWVIIYRMPTDESREREGAAVILDAGAPVKKMKVFHYIDSTGARIDALAVLLTNGKLYVCNLSALTSTLLQSDLNDFAVHTIDRVLSTETRIFATRGYTGGLVPTGLPTSMLLRINPETGTAEHVLFASGDNQFVSVTTDSDLVVPLGGGASVPKNIYLTENVVHCSGVSCEVVETVIRAHRLPVPVLAEDWGIIVDHSGGDNLRSDDRWLYFHVDNTIRRIGTDAPAIRIDLQADALEVVQTSQDEGNSVRLVANKPTFVRGYAHVNFSSSDRTEFFPSAKLRGSLNGLPLEPPLRPINSPTIDKTTDRATLRGTRDRSFVFQLPDSWVRPGALGLTMVVNPDNSSPVETFTAPLDNNSTGYAVTLTRKERTALVLVPVVTEAPLYDPSAPGSGIAEILQRARSMLPVEDFTIFPQSGPVWKQVFDVRLCFCPPWFSELYSVNQRFNLPKDADWALFLVTVWNYSSKWQPPGYRDVHWVGTVHNSSPGEWTGIGGARGVKLKDLVDSLPPFPIPDFLTAANSSVVRMDATSTTFDWNSPRGGVTLAHELGHNYGRFHIDQSAYACGGKTPERPYHNAAYGDFSGLYDPCTLGPTTGWRTIFGFDPIRRKVILPTDAGDLMTYDPIATWTSKITWEAIFDQVPSSSAFASAAVGPVRFAPAAAPGGPVLLIHGFINPAENRAQFWPFYQWPEEAADPLKLAESLNAAAQMPPENPFRVRLLDAAGNLVSDVPLLVSNPADDDHTQLGFVQFLRFDPATRQIQLVNGDTVLSTRAVSAHAPALTLSGPILDVTNQTVTLNWSATDADNDPLLFTVQYSPDDGVTWIAVLVDYPWLSATLDTRMMQGGQRARLRVIATDGVNSTLATTEPFALARHAPELQISGVRESQRVPFGEPAQLHGLALDAEEGSLPDDRLFWSVNGPTPVNGTGSSLSLWDLSPGPYTASLSAADSDNQLAVLAHGWEVLPPAIPEGPEPRLDGECNDPGYANGTRIRIPLGNGDFARAWMLHSGSNLFVCFTELQLPATPGSVRTIGLRIDADASGDQLGTPGDLGFFVDSDGIPFQEAGTGNGMAVTLSPRPGVTALIEKGDNGWSAEFRIADSLLGGWNHAAAISFAHDTAQWPPLAVGAQPATWAPAYFGAQPPPPTNCPPIARAGQSQQVNVPVDTTVYLNGGGSSDPDGDGLTYSWTQASGPPVLLIGASTATPHFLAGAPAATITLCFRLIVSDGEFDSVPVETEVTLRPTPSQTLTNLPLASQTRVVGDTFQFRLLGQPGVPYSIDASSNLVHWQTIHAATADFYATVDFVDRDMTNHPVRFYRTTPAPTNDYLANRTPLTGSSVSVSTANLLATEEPGEPDHFGNRGGKSLWWSWTAPGNGSVTVSTIGSDFDTLLGVYTGDSVSSLSYVASDDDAGGNRASLVTFNAQAGVTYQIAVDGYNGLSGNIQLNIALP